MFSEILINIPNKLNFDDYEKCINKSCTKELCFKDLRMQLNQTLGKLYNTILQVYKLFLCFNFNLKGL